MNRHLRYLGAVGAVGAVYWLAAKAGLQLAYLHGTVAALWPPVGVGMAVLILYGVSLWPVHERTVGVHVVVLELCRVARVAIENHDLHHLVRPFDVGHWDARAENQIPALAANPRSTDE